MSTSLNTLAMGTPQQPICSLFLKGSVCLCLSVSSSCVVCVRFVPEELSASLSVLRLVRRHVWRELYRYRSYSETVASSLHRYRCNKLGDMYVIRERREETRLLQKSYAFYSQAKREAKGLVKIAGSVTVLREIRQAQNHRLGRINSSCVSVSHSLIDSPPVQQFTRSNKLCAQ